MSPRFSGRQYPGAMKDYRAKLREEARARETASDKRQLAAKHIIEELGLAAADAFRPLIDAFVALGKALVGKQESVQSDFALVPSELHGGTCGTPPQYDLGGVLPVGVTVIPGDINEWRTAGPERILTVEEWAEVHRLAKEIGEEK